MLETPPTGPLLLLGVLLLLSIFFLPQLISKSTILTSWRRPTQSSEIISLRMYPIKSCRGFAVTQTTLKEHGLDLDRRWMLVDATTNEFLTIRQIADMTRIGTGLSPDGTELIITIPSPNASDGEGEGKSKKPSSTLRIPSHPTREWLEKNTTVAQVKIWDNLTDGYMYNDEINVPFSAFLGRPAALVYKGPTPRTLKGNGAPVRLGRVQSIGFPDVFPVLIASESSLSELNSRLVAKGSDPITIERFRPNIIVKGGIPWSEDSWKTVRICHDPSEKSSSLSRNLGIEFDIVARCARCQVPNVDPDTAVQHKKQPWDTLVSYRRIDEGIKWKPCFGMLSAPRAEGVIRVGMKLEVLEETKEHKYITGF